ncbi:MAG: diguanylate cyclasephosphodiesterase domain with sensor [Frankiales bacterium]|nr:diguanylate cyclasephosphodiesterase domain with sensor [Frankiales bacterium]
MSDNRTVLDARALADALGRGQLVMHFQPVIRLRNNTVRGVEALLRWNHPAAGMLTAAAFLPELENTAVMRDVTEFALTTACSAVASGAPGSWTVSVNITAADAASKDLLPLVGAALESSGLAPERLVLEITETGALHNHSEASAALTQLRELGIGVSLDDFGTGYSSLSLLRGLPISELKVDAVFVAGLETSSEDAAIVGNIIRLAEAFDASVVAEGVEQEGQVKLLAQLGCGFAQGYLWSRAGPLAEVVNLAPETLAGKSGGLPPKSVADRMLRMAGQDASAASIAAALNRDGINTPDDRRWHGSSVTKVLRQLQRDSARPGCR